MFRTTVLFCAIACPAAAVTLDGTDMVLDTDHRIEVCTPALCGYVNRGTENGFAFTTEASYYEFGFIALETEQGSAVTYLRRIGGGKFALQEMEMHAIASTIARTSDDPNGPERARPFQPVGL